MSIKSALHDDIAMQKVFKEAINFDNIWMVDIKLNLKFPSKLSFHIIFSNLPLTDDFNCANHVAAFFDGHHYFSEGSFSKLFYDYKGTNVNFMLRRLLQVG